MRAIFCLNSEMIGTTDSYGNNDSLSSRLDLHERSSTSVYIVRETLNTKQKVDDAVDISVDWEPLPSRQESARRDPERTTAQNIHE